MAKVTEELTDFQETLRSLDWEAIALAIVRQRQREKKENLRREVAAKILGVVNPILSLDQLPQPGQMYFLDVADSIIYLVQGDATNGDD